MVKTKKAAPLDGLQPKEADAILKSLLANHPELLPEAEKLWRSTLGEVSFETIAFDVQSAIMELDLDDLNGRAGRHSWGYVEPSQAAQDLLEEAVAPFREEMIRKLDLGLTEAAFETCKGIVLGLYQCRNSTGGDILSWAPEFPEEAAGFAVDTLTDDGKRQASFDFGEFMNKHVPEWQWLAKQPGRK